MNSIVKTTDLRKRYAYISKSVHGSRNITIITKRGKPDLGLVDLDYLEDLLEAQDSDFQATLKKAASEKTYTLDEVFDNLED